ncbi:MAG TPA: VacJ family lipoprotein [Casimicrobiaceae bacterium]|nr:VacJ family lipoprotein [Casimicrobiaceae bacterium]
MDAPGQRNREAGERRTVEEAWQQRVHAPIILRLRPGARLCDRCRSWAVALLLVALSGCATTPQQAQDSDDPWEGLNRKVLDVNTALDDAIIRPVAKAYRDIVPQFFRDRFRNFMDNLSEPRIWGNDVLQGRFNAATITFWRFVTNTTLGIAGLWDPASGHNLPRQTGDFGQTLYTWGFDDGPYVVLLFFGPSNVRDTFGLAVDSYTTPPSIVFQNSHVFDTHVEQDVALGLGIVDGIDLRARNIETLDEMKASALDYYSHLRSIWRQYRRAQLREARATKEEPVELEDPGATQNPGVPENSTPPAATVGPQK